jgi:hypothetical protein
MAVLPLVQRFCGRRLLILSTPPFVGRRAQSEECALSRFHFTVLPTSVNTVLSCVPTSWTATTMNTAIRLAISAYSIAVTGSRMDWTITRQ